ncbi:MAG: nicotinate-nucleotide adenylyltransferase [Burkholderiales bacterium]|nr:nicotinate-nucleotide adenylyltransferase [Burkholderiales bacterium]
MATLTPVGILGGTFDPIHNGHLRLAEEVAGLLDLAQIRFIPTGTPPHRAQPAASNAHRAEMVRLAIAGNPRFVMDERELIRAGQSYSFDTVTELRATLPPRTPVVLMMGADAFLSLPDWHRWRELLEICHIVVAQRPGYGVTSWESALGAELWEAFASRSVVNMAPLGRAPGGRIAIHTMTALDISASLLRSQLRSGVSPRYLLPDAVLEYIHRHGLYSTQDAGNGITGSQEISPQ